MRWLSSSSSSSFISLSLSLFSVCVCVVSHDCPALYGQTTTSSSSPARPIDKQPPRASFTHSSSISPRVSSQSARTNAPTHRRASEKEEGRVRALIVPPSVHQQRRRQAKQTNRTEPTSHPLPAVTVARLVIYAPTHALLPPMAFSTLLLYSVLVLPFSWPFFVFVVAAQCS